jgi:hypothetical protein
MAWLVIQATDVLADAFGRIGEGAAVAVDGLSPEDLAHRVTPNANPIGWLVWHLMRVQDTHIAEATGTEQVWTSTGWQNRFDLPYDELATGYGQSREQVGAFSVSAELLDGYARAVTSATLAYVEGLSDSDLEIVVDDSWDPPVTLGIRLLSVVGDDFKHLGQAEYARGLL